MKLEIGQFVRVKGHIGKIANINEFREPDLEVAIDIPHFNDLVFVNRNDVTKASYNIANLIEVGDYVKSKEMSTYFGIKDVFHIIDDIDDLYEEDAEGNIIKPFKIEAILTKEQFETYCYKVGDE